MTQKKHLLYLREIQELKNQAHKQRGKPGERSANTALQVYLSKISSESPALAAYQQWETASQNAYDSWGFILDTLVYLEQETKDVIGLVTLNRLSNVVQAHLQNAFAHNFENVEDVGAYSDLHGVLYGQLDRYQRKLDLARQNRIPQQAEREMEMLNEAIALLQKIVDSIAQVQP